MDTPIGAEVGNAVFVGLGVEVGRAVAVLVAGGVGDNVGVSVADANAPLPQARIKKATIKKPIECENLRTFFISNLPVSYVIPKPCPISTIGLNQCSKSPGKYQAPVPIIL